MTKSELIDALATRRKIARVTAEEVVNLVFDRMREGLADDERIEIRGFGSFKVRRYPGYRGRNPKTRGSDAGGAQSAPQVQGLEAAPRDRER
jgi:integration host factor subunit beta